MTSELIKQEIGLMRFTAITIAVSSIVFFEPAPYDLLIVVLFLLVFFYRCVSYDNKHFWPAILLVIFIETNLLSFFFIRDISYAFNYFVITLYVVISWFGFSGISTRFHVNLLPYVFKAYMFAAVLTVIAGIAAYSNLFPGLDFLLLEGRVQGFFKDPNVFGPFLIPPALYALFKIGEPETRGKTSLLWFILFLILVMGVLLSFSRAAWGHFVLAIGIYFLLIKSGTSKRIKTIFLLLIFAIPVLIYFVTSTDIGNLFFERFGLQSYDQTRFQKQEKALEMILRYPIGFGPGQSELLLNHSTHSLFVRVLTENGLLGFLSFIGFYLICLGRSIRLSLKASSATQGYFVIIFASLIGIFFNSIFIDTMHWRHMWLLLALPFMDVKK